MDLQITNIVVENTCDEYTPLHHKTTKSPLPAYYRREFRLCCSVHIYWDSAKPFSGFTAQPFSHWPEAPLLPCFENPPREFWSPNRCVIPIGSFLGKSVKTLRLPFQRSCDEGGRSIAESRLSFLTVNCIKKLLLCGKRSMVAFCGQQKSPWRVSALISVPYLKWSMKERNHVSWANNTWKRLSLYTFKTTHFTSAPSKMPDKGFGVLTGLRPIRSMNAAALLQFLSLLSCFHG